MHFIVNPAIIGASDKLEFEIENLTGILFPIVKQIFSSGFTVNISQKGTVMGIQIMSKELVFR